MCSVDIPIGSSALVVGYVVVNYLFGGYSYELYLVHMKEVMEISRAGYI